MRHGHHRPRRRVRPVQVVITAAVLILVAAITVAASRHGQGGDPASGNSIPRTLPHAPMSYLGVYASDVPGSFAGVASFTKSTGTDPDVAMYYSGWSQPFETKFARSAAQHNAVTLIQMEPRHISLSAIAAGKYDGYLTSFAAAVKSFGHPVILGFGHEMNGSWYSWGHTRSSAHSFVAAWRHIVTVFRLIGAKNVTWLWTVNVIDLRHNAIPSPAAWWPGKSYVTWVGIDGYYRKPGWSFAPLFGPTIAAVRRFTRDPILIGETGADKIAGKPAKITNLFAGIRAYGLLGFVWYDVIAGPDWRIDDDPAAVAAFHRGARLYNRPWS
jgi:mannan endo-1,4-beta-mannosidase